MCNIFAYDTSLDLPSSARSTNNVGSTNISTSNPRARIYLICRRVAVQRITERVTPHERDFKTNANWPNLRAVFPTPLAITSPSLS